MISKLSILYGTPLATMLNEVISSHPNEYLQHFNFMPKFRLGLIWRKQRNKGIMIRFGSLLIFLKRSLVGVVGKRSNNGALKIVSCHGWLPFNHIYMLRS